MANLVSTEPDNVGQLLNDEIDTLDARLFETRNLLLDDGLEGHVRGEETDSHT